jgi:ceramide glucosyltransferase
MSPVLQVPVQHAAGWLRSAAPLARPALAAHLAEWLRLALPIAQPAAATICMSAILYYLYAIYSARGFFGARPRWTSHDRPPISILKPIRGLDVGAYENFASFCRQDYPRYEVIFGAEVEDEPGLEVARAIARDFPDTDVKIVVNDRSIGTNRKVSNLANMAAEAKYAHLLVSDSDIRVDPSHLQMLARPLEDPEVGVVTCLYRSKASGTAGWIDALGLSTEFQPSVLVARGVEGMSFAMGSGILIRRGVLASIGGFAAFADYLADDFQLGNRPSQLGYRVELSPYVVEHRLSTAGFQELLWHQMRWYRGIRSSRPWGYAGLVFTQGVAAALALVLLAPLSPLAWALAAATVGVRLTMAWFVAVRCLKDEAARRFLWFVPARDLLSCVLWLVAFFGGTIVWRGERFRLERGGRLVPFRLELARADDSAPAQAAR